MDKRENVIKALEECLNASCRGFQPGRYCPIEDDVWETIDDALALLKAQEPVEPKVVDTSSSKLYHSNMFKNYYCGNCGEFLHIVNRKDLFCSQCGRPVKWDD